MVDYADEEMREARDALANAEEMREAGVTEKAVVTRLYYACFHAANEVLRAMRWLPRAKPIGQSIRHVYT